MKKQVIVSACLLGAFCRYDGKTKADSAVIEAFAGWEIIPFCPEAPLFGTPRERISVIEREGMRRIISDVTSQDVTQKLREEIERFIALHPHAKRIVLKSKSPSCGLGTTPILGENKEIIAYGNGIAAELFLQRYSDALISDEILL